LFGKRLCGIVLGEVHSLKPQRGLFHVASPCYSTRWRKPASLQYWQAFGKR
jgi:hypothetical protein